WSGAGGDADMSELIGQITELRRRFPQLRRRQWSREGVDIRWLTPLGADMTPEDWNFPNGRFLCCVVGDSSDGGAPVYIVLNAAPQAIAFRLPAVTNFARWTLELHTGARDESSVTHIARAMLEAPARSVLVFSAAP